MAKVIKPPEPISSVHNVSVFLAGTIDNGAAEEWQIEVQEQLEDYDIVMFNPRRDYWDNKLKATTDNPIFVDQVKWELDAMEQSSYILMNFQENSLSPVTLLELGLYVDTYKLIVCCPKNFWRSGNVKMICDRYNIKVYETLDSAMTELEIRLNYDGVIKIVEYE